MKNKDIQIRRDVDRGEGAFVVTVIAEHIKASPASVVMISAWDRSSPPHFVCVGPEWHSGVQTPGVYAPFASGTAEHPIRPCQLYHYLIIPPR